MGVYYLARVKGVPTQLACAMFDAISAARCEDPLGVEIGIRTASRPRSENASPYFEFA